MADSERLRIAVFIDFDNIEIGVKNTLNASFDAGLVLEALKERGDVVSKTAYSDWQRAGGYSRMLTQHAIKMVQRNLTPGGDKNGADINLALDALEMAFTHPHINAFVIVGGDSDFISLVEKLKQYDKKVFVVGGRQFTSGIMQRNCHEFIAYENLVGARAARRSRRRRAGGRRACACERAPIEQAIPLVTRALKVLSEREVSPQLGLLKSTLLQLDSTFSERSYGAGSFRDFVEKLEEGRRAAGASGQGWLLVELVDGPSRAARRTADETAAVADARRRSGGAERRRDGTPAAAPPSRRWTPARAWARTADGLREFQRILATAEIRRWPMYLRNVKQVIRQASPRSTNAPTDSPISSICCAPRTKRASSASIAIGRASFACSRALRHRSPPDPTSLKPQSTRSRKKSPWRPRRLRSECRYSPPRPSRNLSTSQTKPRKSGETWHRQPRRRRNVASGRREVSPPGRV